MTPITRLERFLAKAAGENVETPEPITRIEMFLDAIIKSSGSGLPSTETASAGDVLSLDDNKAPQWAAPSGGGGGVLVVHDEDGTLDKTWQEIHDAMADGIVVISKVSEKNALSDLILTANDNTQNTGYFEVESVGGDIYAASSANAYPSYAE